jgi:hypothetical protein
MSPTNFYAGRVASPDDLQRGTQPVQSQLAEAALAQARIQEESIRGQVTVNTVSAFFDVLLAQKRLTLVEKPANRKFGDGGGRSGGTMGPGDAQRSGRPVRREQRHVRRDRKPLGWRF